MAKQIKLPVKTTASPGFPGFVGWLADTHPKLYAYVAASDPDTVMDMETRRNPGSLLSGYRPASVLNGLGDVATTATGASSSATGVAQFVQTVVQAGAQILPLVQQQKVLKLQLQRAQAGLPPLDVGAYIDPNQGINVGVTPATQKTLLWIAGGVTGAFLLSRLLGGRR